MENPKIKIKSPAVCKIFNVIALLTFFSVLFYVISQWSILPAEVPSHYNIKGEPDDWSRKSFIFFPPAIGMVLWLPLSILEKYPHVHNHIRLTTENVERVYKNSIMMLNFIKNEMLLIFAFLSFNDVYVATGKGSIFGIWGLPIILLVVFGTLAFFIIRSLRIK